MVEILKTVTTEKGKSPRGDWYDWCSLLDNDTLVFGNEQGNYSGGTTLSYRYYGDILSREYQPEDHIPSDEYWKEVSNMLDYWRKNDKEFYLQIVEMCKKYKSNVFNMISKITSNAFNENED